jgi:hypothetical protein
VALLSWLSLAEWKVLERLYADAPSAAFVVESVRGVLARTPVSKSWQHRFLAPLLVSALGGPSVEAVARTRGVLLLGANLLLFALVRRRGASLASAVLAVVTLGFLHVILAYKLEYPWDGVDQLLFIAFGAWAAAEKEKRSYLALTPLLALGTLNHETILYVPLFCLLCGTRRERVAALASAVVMGGAIMALRAAFYLGRPELPGQVFEVPAPVIENHLHVAHNVRALFVDNWGAGRADCSVLFLGASAVFAWMALRGILRPAAALSLVVLATIVGFGYVNETRHYLLLAAFWVAYAWPAGAAVARGKALLDLAGRDRETHRK